MQLNRFNIGDFDCSCRRHLPKPQRKRRFSLLKTYFADMVKIAAQEEFFCGISLGLAFGCFFFWLLLWGTI